MKKKKSDKSAGQSGTGMYVVLEGISGAGKSTLIERLKSTLFTQLGLGCAYTRQPGSEHLGITEAIRHILKSPGSEDLDPKTKLMLYLADQVEHTKWVRSCLNDGSTVISDRSWLSMVAYQAVDVGLHTDQIWNLICSYGDPIFPDLLFLLVGDTETLLARHRTSGHETLAGFEQKQRSYFETVQRNYLIAAGRMIPDSLVMIHDVTGRSEQEMYDTMRSVIEIEARRRGLIRERSDR